MANFEPVRCRRWRRPGRRRMRTMLPLLSGVVVAALALGVAACGSSSTSASASGGSGLPSLTVGNFDAPDVGTIYFAASEGYFRKVGINVTVKNLTPAEFVPALTSGQVDVSFSALPAIFLAAGKGIGLRALFQSSYFTRNNCSLSVQVLPSSNISSIAQLKGKTLAIESLDSEEELDLAPLLHAAGVSLSQVKFLPVGSQGPAQLAALKRGIAQAMIVTVPYSSQYPAAGDSKIVSNLCAAPAPATFATAAYFTTPAFLSAHKSSLKLFEQGMLNASNYIDAHPAVYDAFLAKLFHLSVKAISAEQLGVAAVTENAASYSYTKSSMVAEGLPVSNVNVSNLFAPLLISTSSQ